MKLTLKRIARRKFYTIGRLLNEKGERICDTLEDPDRGLKSIMPLDQIKNIKVKGDTAIPTGTYEVNVNIVSPKYSNFSKYPYAKIAEGKMPRLMNVPGYQGVLMHAGNTQKDTEGCILLGQNTTVGRVNQSQATWISFYLNYIKPCLAKNEKIYITIY